MSHKQVRQRRRAKSAGAAARGEASRARKADARKTLETARKRHADARRKRQSSMLAELRDIRAEAERALKRHRERTRPTPFGEADDDALPF